MNQACGVKENVVCGLASCHLIKSLPRKFWHICTFFKSLHQMVIIQLTGEELGELFRNPELLCVHVINTDCFSQKRVWFHLVQCRSLYTGLKILV